MFSLCIPTIDRFESFLQPFILKWDTQFLTQNST